MVLVGEHIRSSAHRTLVPCKDLSASMMNSPADIKHKHTRMYQGDLSDIHSLRCHYYVVSENLTIKGKDQRSCIAVVVVVVIELHVCDNVYWFQQQL